MKKQLLLGSALLAAISAFPQAGRLIPEGMVKPVHTAEIINKKIIANYHLPVEATKQSAGPENKPQTPSRMKTSAAPPVGFTSWQPISGSMNVYGVLESNSRPLGFNDELNMVSFVHRKSQSYVPSPVPTSTGAISGVIVGSFTDDWGGRWDSTCIWNNTVYWARYPQGGIYNPPGTAGSNSVITDAYIVAGGPVTTAQSSWQGSFIANKKLDDFGAAGNDSLASPTNSLFVPNYAPYNANTDKFDFPSLHFSSTDDGIVRFMGIVVKNYNGTTSADFGFRGGRVVKGTFNQNTNDFDWTGNTQSDSIIISSDVRQQSGGYGMSIARPHMCWSEDGQTGYVWFIGCDVNETQAANMGYQPIVYKTGDGGNSWTKMMHIDFTDTLKYGPPVLSHLFAARGGTIAIPFFSPGEGMDGIVDRNGDLHILTTLASTFTKFPDSLGYTATYNASSSADGQAYNFGHRPGQRPYIYDFICSASNGWDVLVVDTMSSEAPGTASADAGYLDNPWDATGGTSGTDKVESDGRLQWSRNASGSMLVATWAESDTLFTNNQHKWNALPNVMAKLVTVGPPSTSTAVSAYAVHPNKINVTNPTNTNPNVLIAGRASMHYVSEKCVSLIDPQSACASGTQVAIGIPITVSNNQNTPMQQLSSVTHWFGTAVLNFDNVSESCLKWTARGAAPTNTVVDGLAENTAGAGVSIYPNPASGHAVITINSKTSADANVTVMNSVGQVVRTTSSSLQSGANKIGINIQGLPAGIYMVSVKTNGASVTRKLIVE